MSAILNLITSPLVQNTIQTACRVSSVKEGIIFQICGGTISALSSNLPVGFYNWASTKIVHQVSGSYSSK